MMEYASTPQKKEGNNRGEGKTERKMEEWRGDTVLFEQSYEGHKKAWVELIKQPSPCAKHENLQSARNECEYKSILPPCCLF